MPLSEKISLALSENLLTLLAHSDEHGRLIASIIDPSLFEGEMRNMAETIITYWREHNSAPKTHTSDLFASIIEDKHDRRSGIYQRLVSNTFELFEQGINTKYIMDQLRIFTRLQKLKDAILRAAEELNRPTPTTINQVEDILASILSARDFQFDPGLRLDRPEVLVEHMEKHFSEFRTGIKTFDVANVVPARGTIWMLLGGSGRGKSWLMVHIGKRAILDGKKVLHITPEMSAEDVMQRYYQSIWSVPKYNDEEIQLPHLEEEIDPRSRRAALQLMHSEHVPEFTLSDDAVRLELITRAEYKAGMLNNLIIKRVAPRQMSMNGLRGYLDSLEMIENFIPDLVIADGLYLMKPSNTRDERRIALGSIVEDFRAIMIERNMAGIGSHQLSKAGFKSNRAGVENVGEDWSIIQTADIIAILSSTNAENKYGLARLYADKVRQDKGNISVLLTQCLDIGQFALSEHPLTRNYWDMLDELKRADGDLSDDESE